MKIIKFLSILSVLFLPYLIHPTSSLAVVGGKCCTTQTITIPGWGTSYQSQEVGRTTLPSLQCGYQFPGQPLFCTAPALGFDSVCKLEDNLCDKSTEVCKYNGANPSESICVQRIKLQVAPCPPDTQTAFYYRTAIGCIRTDPGGFVSQVITIGIAVGSGIAFLMLLFGSFKLISSQGNPEGLAVGKEIITSAIVGLIFVILAVTIMQVIGYDILGLGSLGLGTR